MCSNLSEHQLKIDSYIHRKLCINLMATTNQKPIINTQIIKRKKESITLQKAIHHKEIEQENMKETNKNYKSNHKVIKMVISTYLSIITLNVNGLMLQS